MGIKDKMAARTAAIAPLGSAPRPVAPSPEPKTAPGKLLAAMPLLAEKEVELEAANAENAQLRKQLEKAQESSFDVALDKLVEVPGRRRYMSKQKYAELRENLRHNKLIHPIVVRRLPDGRYEVISGHHRIDAYRELERPAIRAVVQESATEDEASAGAFFANLLQSDLTDYEKYLGFKDRQNRHPELTRAQMAELSGLSETSVSFIFSFDNLPSDVLSIVNEHPELLGASAAYALAGLAKEGRSEQVVAAVKKLAAGEIDQGQAVKLASTAGAKTRPDSAKAVSDKIKVGKSVYCQMRRAKNIVRLEFSSEQEAERVHQAIRSVLEEESKASARDPRE